MHRESRNMVPVRSGFVVDEQHQTVIKAAGAEMEERTVDGGRQTDPAVANHSERYKERCSRQLSLGRVVIGHLAHQEGAVFSGLSKNEQLLRRRQMGRKKAFGPWRDPEP